MILWSYESTSVEDLYQLIYEEIQQHKSKVDYLSFLLSGSEKVNNEKKIELLKFWSGTISLWDWGEESYSSNFSVG